MPLVARQGTISSRSHEIGLRSRRPTVLIIDDEEVVLTSTQKVVEAFGMHALAAGSTAEALRIVGKTQIDVVLVDWRLGGQEDGMALGRSLWRDWNVP